MKIFKTLLLFALVGFLFSSCEYEWIQPIKPPIPDVVSYSADIQPIFDRDCNSSACHAAGSTPPDLSEGNSYDALINGNYVDVETPEASILYTTMKSGSMRFYTNPGDEEIVLAWIEQGALNN